MDSETLISLGCLLAALLVFILLLTIRPACPRCGSATWDWIEVDGRRARCRRCGYLR